MEPNSLNPYLYVLDNPLFYTDPLGDIPIRELAEKNNATVSWDETRGVISISSENNIDNHDLIIRNGTVSIGRNGIIYGDLKNEDAKIIDGHVDISEATYNKFLNNRLNSDDKSTVIEDFSDILDRTLPPMIPSNKLAEEKHHFPKAMKELEKAFNYYRDLPNNKALIIEAIFMDKLMHEIAAQRTHRYYPKMSSIGEATIEILDLRYFMRVYGEKEEIDPSWIAAILTKEISTLDLIDEWQTWRRDGVKTIGYAQTNVERSIQNEQILQRFVGDNREYIYKGKSNEDIIDILLDKYLNP
jgi:hypothetical protein